MSGAASLYRRHRPRTFDDVIGQDHVVRTLRNAVDQGKVHHAYLFAGGEEYPGAADRSPHSTGDEDGCSVRTCWAGTNVGGSRCCATNTAATA